MNFEIETYFVPGDRIQGTHMEVLGKGLMFISGECETCKKGPTEGRIIEGMMLGNVHKNDGIVVIKFYGECHLANIAVKTGNTCKLLYIPGVKSGF